MDWFLYNNSLRHERVKCSGFVILTFSLFVNQKLGLGRSLVRRMSAKGCLVSKYEIILSIILRFYLSYF